MKHWMIIGILLILSVNALEAQDTITKQTVIVKEDGIGELRKLELGVRYMPTFSALDFNTYNNEVVQGTLTLSHGWAGVLGINFTKNIGIQAEVDYYELSQKYQDFGLERQVNIKYYNIPLLVSLNTDKTQAVNLNLVGGPQFGLNAGSEVIESSNRPENGSDSLKAVIAIKEGDVGLAYGAGLEFMLNDSHTIRLDLGFRGFYGLVDMTSEEVNRSNGTYNIIVKASRQTFAGYGGLTLLF